MKVLLSTRDQRYNTDKRLNIIKCLEVSHNKVTESEFKEILKDKEILFFKKYGVMFHAYYIGKTITKDFLKQQGITEFGKGVFGGEVYNLDKETLEGIRNNGYTVERLKKDPRKVLNSDLTWLFIVVWYNYIKKDKGGKQKWKN